MLKKVRHFLERSKPFHHPFSWFLIIFIWKYVLVLPFSNIALRQHGIELPIETMASYVILVLSSILVLILIIQKYPISFLRIKLELTKGAIGALVLMILFSVVLRLSYHGTTGYILLQQGTPGWYWFIMIVSWMCIAAISKQNKGYLSVLILTEILCLILAGQRMWLFVFVSLMVYFHMFTFSHWWKEIIVILFVLVFVVSPVSQITRTIVSYDGYPTGSTLYQKLNIELHQLPHLLKQTLGRFAAEASALRQALTNDDENAKHHISKKITNDMSVVFIPRMVYPAKPELTPGRDAHHFLFPQCDIPVSYPMGLLAYGYVLFSWTGIVFVWLFWACIMWIFHHLLNRYKTNPWFITGLLFYFPLAIFWEDHLVFYLSNMIRSGIVVGAFLFVLYLMHRFGWMKLSIEENT